MTILSRGEFPGVGSGKQNDLLRDHSSLEKTQKKTAHDLVVENRLPLLGAGTGRKCAYMVQLSQEPSRLVPKRGHHDALAATTRATTSSSSSVSPVN